MNLSKSFLCHVKPPVEGTCRICTQTHHDVISIFGEQGRRLQLAEKLDKYMSIKIFAWDNLPRSLCTICKDCVLLTAKYSRMETAQTDSENTESASENSSNEEELLMPRDLSMKLKPKYDPSSGNS